MRTIRAALFDRDERALFAKAALSPPSPSTLTTRARQHRHQHQDPRLTLLRGLARSAHDPILYPRLLLARDVLAAIISACEAQMDPTFFYTSGKAHTTEGIGDATRLFADPEEAVRLLTDIRAGQAQEARDALAVIERALSQMDPTDDPHHTADDTEKDAD